MAVATRRKASVVIVDDHVVVAEALEIALAGADDCTVSRIVVPVNPAPISDLVATIVEAGPDVALINLDLGPYGDGAPLVAPLARCGVEVIVFTGSTDRARWGQVLEAGACSVLSKSRPLAEVKATVERINRGLPVVDRFDRDELIAAWTRRRSIHGAVEDRLEQLTARERAVLGSLMRGRSVRQIAEQSVVSEATVRTQVKAILAKLKVSSQLAAVGLANQVGWRPPRPV